MLSCHTVQCDWQAKKRFKIWHHWWDLLMFLWSPHDNVIFYDRQLLLGGLLSKARCIFNAVRLQFFMYYYTQKPLEVKVRYVVQHLLCGWPEHQWGAQTEEQWTAKITPEFRIWKFISEAGIGTDEPAWERERAIHLTLSPFFRTSFFTFMHLPSLAITISMLLSSFAFSTHIFPLGFPSFSWYHPIYCSSP